MIFDLKTEDLSHERAHSHETQAKDFSFIQNKRVPSPVGPDYANLSAENTRNHNRNESESAFY